MAEEIVADGQPYEKSLGPAGKGVVTAQWGADGASLWIDVQAGSDPVPQRNASQRSVWKLSQDGRVWVRESVSISQGTPRQARLVFRKVSPEAAPTPGARPTPRPARRVPRTPRTPGTPRTAPTP